MKVKYNYYLKINDFDKSINVIFKYLRRYYIKIFDKKIGEFQTVKRKKSVSRDSPLYDFQKEKYNHLIEKGEINKTNQVKNVK